MQSFQRLVEMPEVLKVKSTLSPPGFFVEFKRDKNGKVTEFITHTKNGPLTAESFHTYHPFMRSQNANWSVIEDTQAPTVASKSIKKK